MVVNVQTFEEVFAAFEYFGKRIEKQRLAEAARARKKVMRTAGDYFVRNRRLVNIDIVFLRVAYVAEGRFADR